MNTEEYTDNGSPSFCGRQRASARNFQWRRIAVVALAKHLRGQRETLLLEKLPIRERIQSCDVFHRISKKTNQSVNDNPFGHKISLSIVCAQQLN